MQVYFTSMGKAIDITYTSWRS